MRFMGIDHRFRMKFRSQNPRLILTIPVHFCFEVTIQTTSYFRENVVLQPRRDSAYYNLHIAP